MIAPVLIVAATERELAPLRLRLQAAAPRDDRIRAELRVVGVGKAACALRTERATAEIAPSRILLVGCAGAFDGESAPDGTDQRLDVGDVVIGDEEVFADEGVRTDQGILTYRDLDLALATRDGETLHDRVPLDAPPIPVIEGWRLRLVSRGEIPYRITRGRLATVSTGSGTDESAREILSRWSPLAESLEGAAAALVAWTRGLPFTEIRGISNRVGRRDRAAWNIDLACERAAAVAMLWLESHPPSQDRDATGGPPA